MTETEKIIFHKNYNYMWDKLNTSYYWLLGPSKTEQAKDSLNRIRGKAVLPSYTICSKCKNEDYEPNKETVKKIVMFYNQNLGPEISVLDFLHEDLSNTNDLRYCLHPKYDERFIGIFYGYYFSSVNSGIPTGAILKIYSEGKKENKILRANLITGFHADEELYSNQLKKLFETTPVTQKSFDEYYNSRPLDKMRCYYYEGTVELTDTSLVIIFHDCSAEGRKLIFTLNIADFSRLQSDSERLYAGGLAFILTTNDAPFDARIYQMGLIRQEYKKLSLNDKRLEKLLKLRTNGKDFRLTSKLDRAWYELALETAKKF